METIAVNAVDAIAHQPVKPLSPLTDKLLVWFDGERRTLPWRAAPCGARDPYRVWLAEIMLQQTQVASVIPYYETFLAKWPDVKALAAADDQAVMHAWAGLGYYARARNMLKCARAVAEQRQGAFPRDEADLLTLPGIGAYTAAAVAAIAFNKPAAPVDGNVIRTLSRLYAIEDEMPKGKDAVAKLARALLPNGRSGDFAEALMDLGATVCKPKNPDCAACPWNDDCRAKTLGNPTGYPKRAAKAVKPTRYGWAFWVQREDGCVLLEQRPDKGLLGGMMGFPGTDWQSVPLLEANPQPQWGQASQEAACEPLAGLVKHTFTHFHLELKVARVAVGQGEPVAQGIWCQPDALDGQALPTVMKKVARIALGG